MNDIPMSRAGAPDPHVLVIPHPVQGHVAPLMKLSLQIASHGVRVTFANLQSIHDKVMASLTGKQIEDLEQNSCSLLSLVAIPETWLDHHNSDDHGFVLESRRRHMPGQVKKLIQSLRQSDQDISCVIVDVAIQWMLDVPKEMGIHCVAFDPFGPQTVALSLTIPHLIDAGILDHQGTLIKGESITLSDETTPWKRSEFPWSLDDLEIQKAKFQHIWNVPSIVKNIDLILANRFHELDPSTSKMTPNILPIGPLLASNNMGPFPGYFWPEDPTCLSWLDKQSPGSVIYAAFGTTAIISPHQFHEIALGLELSGLPFLWVVNPNLTKLPQGFVDRVADRGKFVEWAPQEKVLAHPSVACFFTHCGWNSAMEGINNGVPFLCFPSFADQFHNRSYICDVWKIGLELAKDENGFITREEMSTKIQTLISSYEIKERALRLKEMAQNSIHENGSSFNNFQSFIERIKRGCI